MQNEECQLSPFLTFRGTIETGLAIIAEATEEKRPRQVCAFRDFYDQRLRVAIFDSVHLDLWRLRGNGDSLRSN